LAHLRYSAILEAAAPLLRRRLVWAGTGAAGVEAARGLSEDVLCSLWAEAYLVSWIASRFIRGTAAAAHRSPSPSLPPPVAPPPLAGAPLPPPCVGGAGAAQSASNDQNLPALAQGGSLSGALALPAVPHPAVDSQDLKILIAIAVEGTARMQRLLDMFPSGVQELLHRLCVVAAGHFAEWQRFLASDHDWHVARVSSPGVGAGQVAAQGHTQTWREQTRHVMKTLNAYELRPRVLKYALSDKDGRAANGRCKQGGVRWAAPESSSSSSEGEDEKSCRTREHGGGFNQSNTLCVEHAPWPAQRAGERQFLETDSGFLAAALLRQLSAHKSVAAGFPADCVRSIAAMLPGAAERGRGPCAIAARVAADAFHAHLLHILSSICAHNPQAAQRVSQLAGLPKLVNTFLGGGDITPSCRPPTAAPPGSADIAPLKRRRAMGCECHGAAVEASGLVSALIRNCHVDVGSLWRQDRSLLGLLWRQSLCPNHDCKLAAVRALRAVFASEGSADAEEEGDADLRADADEADGTSPMLQRDSPRRAAQDTVPLTESLLALMASTKSPELLQALAVCLGDLLRGAPEHLRAQLRARTESKDLAGRKIHHKSQQRRGASGSPLAPSRQRLLSAHGDVDDTTPRASSATIVSKVGIRQPCVASAEPVQAASVDKQPAEGPSVSAWEGEDSETESAGEMEALRIKASKAGTAQDAVASPQRREVSPMSSRVRGRGSRHARAIKSLEELQAKEEEEGENLRRDFARALQADAPGALRELFDRAQQRLAKPVPSADDMSGCADLVWCAADIMQVMEVLAAEHDALFSTNWLSMTPPRAQACAHSGGEGAEARDWLSLVYSLLKMEKRPRLAAHVEALNAGGSLRAGELRQVQRGVQNLQGAAASVAAVLAHVVPGAAVWLTANLAAEVRQCVVLPDDAARCSGFPLARALLRQHPAAAAALNTSNLLLDAACLHLADTAKCESELDQKQRHLAALRDAVRRGLASPMSCLVLDGRVQDAQRRLMLSQSSLRSKLLAISLVEELLFPSTSSPRSAAPTWELTSNLSDLVQRSSATVSQRALRLLTRLLECNTQWAEVLVQPLAASALPSQVVWNDSLDGPILLLF